MNPLSTLVLTTLITLVSTTCFADRISELQAQRKTAEKKIADLDAAKLKRLQERQRIDAELSTLGVTLPAAPSTGSAEDKAKASAPPTLATRAFNYLGPDGLNATIRRSLSDKRTSELPALLQYTRPGNGADSWSADIGMSIEPKWFEQEGPWGSKLLFAAQGEYHYNAAASALKDKLDTGLGLDLVWAQDIERDLYHELSFSGSFVRDNIVAGEGWGAEVLYKPNLGAWSIGNKESWVDLLSWRLRPYAGVQTQSGNGATADFASGTRVSLHAGLALTATLFPRALGNRLEWTNKLDYWNHASTSGGFDAYKRDQLYWISAINYWLNTDTNNDGELDPTEKHFGITAQYINGDNPDEGDFDADIMTIGFAIKF